MTEIGRLIQQLSDQDAISILAGVTKKWIKRNPEVALHVIRQTDGYAWRQDLQIPEWVDDPSKSPQEAAALARKALDAMVVGEDEDVRSWSRLAVEKPSVATAHLIDPVTGTLCLAGLILASRVKKVGPDGIEFYEGIPEGLAKVLQAAKNFFGLG